MPKREDIKSILIIGAGPIVIGQACEFDYAGTQACKALKTEGYRIILINSNPATIMTDHALADATYIEPITLTSLEKIIQLEKPDAILPTLGGQTALNCAVAAAQSGLLEKYNIELIGASLSSIQLAEDREKFRNAMQTINLDLPRSVTIKNLSEVDAALAEIKLPAIIRASFALGGSGSGLAKDEHTFKKLCTAAFLANPSQAITIDEALIGWKEFELEVVRDKNDNCIVVCGIENVDPLGIHTGDSIAVAPIQTLTDKEYQSMRQAAFAVLRKVGVETGGSNVQFAVHPSTGRMVVIEMNPRVSRSSALVSKASGFPIAKVAAKLAVGFTLDELKNDITGSQLPASFEPTLDYVVVKIPKFNFEKFKGTTENRGTQMYSVGEVMAIGRTFPESLQKAMRSIDFSTNSLETKLASLSNEELKDFIAENNPYQLWAICAAMHRNVSCDAIQTITNIDPWFLNQIKLIIETEVAIGKLNLKELNKEKLLELKRLGFSDTRLTTLLHCTLPELIAKKNHWQIEPTYKRIDSCAGEYSTSTAYLYSSYEEECESAPSDKPKIIIIGSGANRIGQGIEFDYACVQAAIALQKLNFETIMLNCNPETVSTDYDVVDKLYCTPLTFEDVYDIIQKEKPQGVLLQFGGQTPLSLAASLHAASVNLIGLTQEVIYQTEDRKAFQTFLQKLNLQQPHNTCVKSLPEALLVAEQLKYPLIVRPSYVLGGASMRIVHNKEQLTQSLKSAFALSDHPVLIEVFLQNAVEIDVDAITDGNEVLICGILEHVEPAGVHSGDSACILPPIHLSQNLLNEITVQTKKIGLNLSLRGLFNIQFAILNDEIYVIEVNPRASRTLPFLCKASGLPLIELAVQSLFGINLPFKTMPPFPAYFVKEAVLPFAKFKQACPLLGPEMKSTGEVMGIGVTAFEAYAKAQIAAGNGLPQGGNACLIGLNEEDAIFQHLKQQLLALHFNVFQEINPDTKLIIAIDGFGSDEKIKSVVRYAVDNNICYATTIAAATNLIGAINFNQRGDITVKSLQQIYQQPRHLLTGEELSKFEAEGLLEKAAQLKAERNSNKHRTALANKELALIFEKQSLRTRFSFTIAMRELGGNVVESSNATRKKEEPEDLAGVLSGYCHAIMLRTFADEMLYRLATKAKIPVINGLSDLHHPCQIFADLLTLQENFATLKNITLAYIGDGNNILHSLLLLAPRLGVNIHYCCPPTRGPNLTILQKAIAYTNENTGTIIAFNKPEAAVKDAHAIYTDVWTSMGFEETSAEQLFAGFQVNEDLLSLAQPDAIFMHCLPMERGKEVSETLPDHPRSVIYQQSENRLHVQKALLLHLLQEERAA